MGICIAGVAAPSAASRDPEDNCGIELRRLCCSGNPAVMVMECSKQRIPLDLGPGRFEVFVNGELVTGDPDELALRADEVHAVYVKRAGYFPELVVLKTDESSGKPRLSPEVVKVRLRPRTAEGRAVLEITVDEED